MYPDPRDRPDLAELDQLAKTRSMPAITRSNGQRLITEREYHLNMIIGCTLCFGIGVLIATIAYAYIIA